MALRDILVHLDASDAAAVRLEVAGHLAKRHEALLIALFIEEADGRLELRTGEMGLVPAADLDVFRKKHAEWHATEVARLKTLAEETATRAGVAFEWRPRRGSSRLVFPGEARCADVCLIGQESPADDVSAAVYSFSEEMLFATGGPVIYVPSTGSFANIGQHVVVAWNASRFAAGAVRDALPILQGADKVTVLSINPDRYKSHDEMPADAIVRHLERHCRAVEFVACDLTHGGIATEILLQTNHLGGDLLVTGGFGHPRLWEKMLGGVTRDLLAEAQLPLLMSH